ncbi:hypothetical protein EEB14_48790 [Rhodococcus sp. WS4]|nr:hypothetical protein EEB14_48790 [Rhodococcus sp. WS4]
MSDLRRCSSTMTTLPNFLQTRSLASRESSKSVHPSRSRQSSTLMTGGLCRTPTPTVRMELNLIDLRSDTVTRPTARMREAMRDAEVGDDARRLADGTYGDPTVNILEAEAAEVLGKEAALFLISGTMGNFAALRTWCNRGDSVAIGRMSHLYRKEAAAFDSEFHGLEAIALPDETGIVEADALKATLTEHHPVVLSLENTHNAACGLPWAAEEAADVISIARATNVTVHLDGARIFNAATALKVEVTTLTNDADSVMFCLSKGLGAPLGSILAGPRDFIDKARTVRKHLGGQWRQAGVAAAAGRIALYDIESRLSRDHERAQNLAVMLGPELVEPGKTRTNMVQLRLPEAGPSAHAVVSKAADDGILLHAGSPTSIRLVTHQDLSDADIEKAAKVLTAAVTHD